MASSREHSVLIASIVSLCGRATIDICGGLDQVIRSIIVISLKYLDRKLLLDSVVPFGYVDWNYVDNASNILGNKQNLLGDSEMWLHLLPYLDFGKLILEPLELKSMFPPIWTLYRTMEEHVGHDKDWTFNDTCKLFLLSNLIGIPFKFVTERYTTRSRELLITPSHALIMKTPANSLALLITPSHALIMKTPANSLALLITPSHALIITKNTSKFVGAGLSNTVRM
jgi:hypothetical protein